MSLLAHLLREYDERYDHQSDESDDFQDAEYSDDEIEQPAAQQPEKKVHKIKQTFSVDQGSTKLDTTVMIRVVADNDAEAKKVADQQLTKLAAYMRDIDLNHPDQSSDTSDDRYGKIRERANKLWQR